MKRIFTFIIFAAFLLTGLFAKQIAYGIDISDKIENLTKKGYKITEQNDGSFLVEMDDEKKKTSDKLIKNLYIEPNDSDIVSIILEYVEDARYEDLLAMLETDHGKGMQGDEIESYTKKYESEPTDEDAIKLLFSGQLFEYLASFSIAQIAIELDKDIDVKDFTLWTKNDMSIFLVLSSDNTTSAFFINTKGY